MQKKNTTLVMMVTHPLLYPAVTEVNSRAVLASDDVRLSLTALFHTILKQIIKFLQHKENLQLYGSTHAEAGLTTIQM